MTVIRHYAAGCYRMYSALRGIAKWRVAVLESSPYLARRREDIDRGTSHGDNGLLPSSRSTALASIACSALPGLPMAALLRTSAATVAVLREADEILTLCGIEAKDLRIDSFCSSRPGGQSRECHLSYSARAHHAPARKADNWSRSRTRSRRRSGEPRAKPCARFADAIVPTKSMNLAEAARPDRRRAGKARSKRAIARRKSAPTTSRRIASRTTESGLNSRANSANIMQKGIIAISLVEVKRQMVEALLESEQLEAAEPDRGRKNFGYCRGASGGAETFAARSAQRSARLEAEGVPSAH